MQVDEERVGKRLVTGLVPCNYQVNFTQTFEKSQKVKCELGALPSGEVEVHENKSVRWKIEPKELDLERTEYIFR